MTDDLPRYNPHPRRPGAAGEAERGDVVSDPQPLAAIRKAKGLSLRQLSALTGLSVAYISKVEKGDSSPTLRVLDQLCEALNVSQDALLGRSRPAPRTAGKLSVERLVHMQCGACQGWWTVGDAPEDRLEWYCPWCGELNEMGEGV